MNKWTLITLIFLIILTGFVFSIETSQNKIVSITNQSFRVTNSEKLLNTDFEIKNKNITANKSKQVFENKTIELQTANKNIEQKTKISASNLETQKIDNLLNKKTKVINIWDENKIQNNKISNQQNLNKTTTKTDFQKSANTKKDINIIPQSLAPAQIKLEQNTPTTSTQKSITTQTTPKISSSEKFANLTPKVTTKPPTKSNSINFTSPNFQTELNTYIMHNVKFPQGYVVSFSFSYTKNGDIAEIHIISISEKDYLDGNEKYASNIYGDACKRNNLSENEMYYNKDSTKSDLIAVSINNSPDGKNLKAFYDTLKKLGTNHKIEQISYEEQDNYNSIGGMYYQGNLYLYTN